MVGACVSRGGVLPGRWFRGRGLLLATALPVVALACLAAAPVMADPVGGNAPRNAPQAAPATEPAVPTVRRFEDVRSDLDVQGAALANVLPGMDSLFDESKRAAIAPKALPIMKKMAALLDEAEGMAPQALQLRRARMELSAMMSLLGDDGGTLQLRKQSVSTDEDEAASATAWEYVVAFANARRNADGQKAALADLTALARGNPDNEMIAQAAYLMDQQAANPEISAAAEKVISGILKGPMPERMAADLANARKLHALENKPMVIEGLSVDGKPFSTAQWKGKVVLVDFWATWCPPCMHEFAHILKLYEAAHASGLEIVGVSCDNDAGDLKSFLKVNPRIAWPQLFDPHAAAQHAFNPLAVGFGVRSIPTLFLIDRKGILRTVDAGANLDATVTKLLAEKAE